MKIVVGISKKHVHLTEKTFKILFGNRKLPVRNKLRQPGQYASTLTVHLKWNKKILEHVRIVGPFRKYNQIEVSASDAKILGLKPPVRGSGDIKDSLPITLIGPNGEITLKQGLVIAERHVHFTSELAKEFDLKDKETVKIIFNDNEITDAKIKVLNPSYLEFHLDNDEAKKYKLQNDDEVEIRKCGE